MWQHAHFYWNELNTRDPQGAMAFYGETLGWTFDAMPDGDLTYWICKDGDTPVGGIFDMSREGFDGLPPHWFAYVAVEDIDACVEKITKAGGRLKRPPFDVPGAGRIAIVEDPNGAVLGWMTPAQQG